LKEQLIVLSTIVLVSPNQYGYFTVYYNYAKYLSREIKVIYVCFDQGDKKFEGSENIKVEYVVLSKSKIIRIIKYYRTIVRLYKANRPAKVMLKYYFLSSVLNLFIPRKDLILDIRTGYISKTRIKTLFFNSIIRNESFIFKSIITLSERLREKLKLQVHKATIISLGADPVETSFKEFDRIILFYIGTLTSRNIPETIEGLSRFINNCGRNIEINYYIVGGGNQADVKKLTDTIKHFRLEEIVHYKGPVYGEDLKWFFKNCNVGVSYIPMMTDYDCQPATKTIEYLMAGMPVIATETGENKQIISDFNGILIEDNSQSFAKGLEKFVSERANFDSDKIINSVKEYSFEYIVNTKLKPVLFS